MSVLDPVTPALTVYSQEYGSTPVGEAIASRYHVGTNEKQLSRASERVAVQLLTQQAVEQPSTSATHQIAQFEHPQSALPPPAASGGNAPPPNDLAMLSQNPAALAQQTISLHQAPAENQPIIQRYWVANETDRLFQEPQPEEALFPSNIHEIHIIQPQDEQRDRRWNPGHRYTRRDEEEKKELRKLEQRNLIVDEAASWKGHETKTQYFPESLSKASEDLISSFLPFAGLYHFSDS